MFISPRDAIANIDLWFQGELYVNQRDRLKSLQGYKETYFTFIEKINKSLFSIKKSYKVLRRHTEHPKRCSAKFQVCPIHPEGRSGCMEELKFAVKHMYKGETTAGAGAENLR